MSNQTILHLPNPLYAENPAYKLTYCRSHVPGTTLSIFLKIHQSVRGSRVQIAQAKMLCRVVLCRISLVHNDLDLIFTFFLVDNCELAHANIATFDLVRFPIL